jgi:hypothetical protein
MHFVYSVYYELTAAKRFDHYLLFFRRRSTNNSLYFACVLCLLAATEGGYTLVTLPRTVTPYRDSVDGTRDHVTYQKLVTRWRYGHVQCTVGIWPSHQRDDTVTAWAGLDVQRDTSPPSDPLAFFTFMMLLAPVTNWEPHGVTLAGYRYAMRERMEVQTVIL